METTVPSLTRREQEVFEALKSAEGPMPTGQLAAQVFGFSDASALQEVRVWVSRLRAKGIPIRTVLGIGYMIDHCEEGHTWGCVVCGARQADGGTLGGRMVYNPRAYTDTSGYVSEQSKEGE